MVAASPARGAPVDPSKSHTSTLRQRAPTEALRPAFDQVCRVENWCVVIPPSDLVAVSANTKIRTLLVGMLDPRKPYKHLQTKNTSYSLRWLLVRTCHNPPVFIPFLFNGPTRKREHRPMQNF